MYLVGCFVMNAIVLMALSMSKTPSVSTFSGSIRFVIQLKEKDIFTSLPVLAANAGQIANAK